MTARQHRPSGDRGAESDAGDVGGSLPTEPRYDPLCGRCGGPSGPEGAWCDSCIRICKEHMRQLDAGAVGAR
jgi:hypothetical protein